MTDREIFNLANSGTTQTAIRRLTGYSPGKIHRILIREGAVVREEQHQARLRGEKVTPISTKW